MEVFSSKEIFLNCSLNQDPTEQGLMGKQTEERGGDGNGTFSKWKDRNDAFHSNFIPPHSIPLFALGGLSTHPQILSTLSQNLGFEPQSPSGPCQEPKSSRTNAQLTSTFSWRSREWKSSNLSTLQTLHSSNFYPILHTWKLRTYIQMWA